VACGPRKGPDFQASTTFWNGIVRAGLRVAYCRLKAKLIVLQILGDNSVGTVNVIKTIIKKKYEGRTFIGPKALA